MIYINLKQKLGVQNFTQEVVLKCLGSPLSLYYLFIF